MATDEVEAGACHTPVYLLVHWDVDKNDMDKLARYGKALGESGLYAKYGGQHVIRSRPIDVFEGDWPKERISVMSRWPCLANLRAYYHSKEYQNDIKPLRDGAGEPTIVVFEQSNTPTKTSRENANE